MKLLQTQKSLIFAAVAASLFASSSNAAITVLGNSSAYTSGSGSDNQPHTLSYDPGVSSTAIVVAVAMESNGSPVSVTFDGDALTPVLAASGSNVGLYYLNNPTTGSASNLVFDYTGVSTVNFIGFQAVSLQASGLIEDTATATDTDLDLTLSVLGADSFVMAGYNFNDGSGATTIGANAPLSPLFGGFINSGGAAFGYAEAVASGNQNYSFSLGGAGSPSQRRITAASFEVIPEPGSAALIGLGGLLAMLRRRRS